MARPSVVPTDGPTLERALSDPTRVQQIIRDGKLPEFVGAYARAVKDEDPGFEDRIRDEVQIQMAAVMRENGVTGRPDMTPTARSGAAYNRRAPGTVMDGVAPGFGEFVAALSPRTRGGREGEALFEKIRNASEGIPSSGGFLVPEEYRSDVMTISLESSIVRPRAAVLPMGSLRLNIPVNDSTTNVGSTFGGITTYWTEEGGTITPSDPSFGRVAVEAKKLTAMTNVPNELLRDFGGAEAWLKLAFGQAMSFEEDDKFFVGNGTGEPLGVLHSANGGAITVDKVTGQEADTIVWENIVAMFSRMLPGSLGRAVWIANIDTFPELATMALSVGVGGAPVWIGGAQGNTAAGAAAPPLTVLGRPVFFTEKSSKLGDAGDIAFVDFGHYIIGDRQQMEITTSEHYRYANDETVIRAISRLDGRPAVQSPITPRRGTNILSPYVLLGARA